MKLILDKFVSFYLLYILFAMLYNLLKWLNTKVFTLKMIKEGCIMALTPMMRQYVEIKERYKDCILFYRLGDFYEMFFEDAKIASKELELVLTGRECGLEERAPMCGIPFHAATSYISKLVNKGYKVAFGEQVEDPAAAKGIVKRDVIKVITPGTFVENTTEE